MSTAGWGAVATLASLLLGSLFTLFRERRGSLAGEKSQVEIANANAASLLDRVAAVEARERWLTDQLRDVQRQLDEQRRRADELEIEARRFHSRPDNASPMSHLHSDGWLELLNRVAAETDGVKIRVHFDDIDGVTANGLDVEAVEYAGPDLAPSDDVARMLQRRRRDAARKVRVARGLPPMQYDDPTDSPPND